MRTTSGSYKIYERNVKESMNMTIAKPRMAIYNVRSDKFGSALQIELHPGTLQHQGSIMIQFARQNSYIAESNTGGFDWDNSLKFRINMIQAAELVSVIKGFQDGMGGSNGKDGLYISRKYDIVIFNVHWRDDAEHTDRPFVATAVADGDVFTYEMTRAEAIAIQCALEYAMPIMAFGVIK